MAEEEDEENKVPKVDPIVFLRDWFKTRVLSSLKCKEDLVNGLIDKEPSATAVDSFWKESEVQRLIVYFKDAELLAVRARTRPDIPRTIVARPPFFLSRRSSPNVTKLTSPAEEPAFPSISSVARPRTSS